MAGMPLHHSHATALLPWIATVASRGPTAALQCGRTARRRDPEGIVPRGGWSRTPAERRRHRSIVSEGRATRGWRDGACWAAWSAGGPTPKRLEPSLGHTGPRAAASRGPRSRQDPRPPTPGQSPDRSDRKPPLDPRQHQIVWLSTVHRRRPVAPLANTWRLSSVERASMTEQVLRELREAIIEGRIPQGEPLREVSLAGTLGTGRSAVREAIRQLVQEGLVDSEPHRGAFVRVMSVADRLDVYVAREAIETGAARRILDAPAKDLTDLRAALDNLAQAARDNDRVTQPVIDTDIRFHQELVRLAGSPRLVRAHDTLAAESKMLLRHHPEYPRARYVTDHADLLEAIEQRDPATPELVADHLRRSRDLIASELANAEGDAPAMPAARPRPDSPEDRRVV